MSGNFPLIILCYLIGDLKQKTEMKCANSAIWQYKNEEKSSKNNQKCEIEKKMEEEKNINK